LTNNIADLVKVEAELQAEASAEAAIELGEV
jgi:hypothetical protein